VELPREPFERDYLVSLIEEAVGAEAAALLHVYSVNHKSGTRYFLGIEDSVLEFMIINTFSNDLADLIMSPNTVRIDLDRKVFGGGTDDTDRPNADVFLDIADLPSVNAELRLGKRINLFGFPYRIRSFDDGIQQPMTPSIALWHEFGHAWAIVNGIRNNSAIETLGLDWENRMRRRIYGPLGPNNARRIRD
jgi:hypothetical protein